VGGRRQGALAVAMIAAGGATEGRAAPSEPII
jgi:hypothetical protein